MITRAFRIAVVGIATGMFLPVVAQTTDETTQQTSRRDVPETPLTSQELRQRLVDGNRRFVAGELLHPHTTARWRDRLASHQMPFATVLGCSDSRVPIELLFDQGFGDLFVVRVAGNVVDPDVVGSVEYGVDHLRTRLVVVMGHQNCGAMTAALYATKDKEPDEINSLLRRIQPALHSVPKSATRVDRIVSGVEANVRQSVNLLKRVSDLKQSVDRGDVKIVGCLYSLDTGRVQFLDDTPGTALPKSETNAAPTRANNQNKVRQ